MERRAVELRIAGQAVRVVSTAPDEVLQRLARVVEEKLAAVAPRPAATQPQAIVLAAIALAHELEEERARRVALEQRTRELLRRVLGRIDGALASDAGQDSGTIE